MYLSRIIDREKRVHVFHRVEEGKKRNTRNFSPRESEIVIDDRIYLRLEWRIVPRDKTRFLEATRNVIVAGRSKVYTYLS